jgi:hypothetical protein
MIQHEKVRMRMARGGYVLALGGDILIMSKFLSIHVG